MKKLIFLAMSLGVMACTRDVVDNAPAPFQNLPETRAGGDGKYDILGYGYDATGKYAHRAYVKSPVLDIQAIKNSADSDRLHIDYMPYGGGEYFIGETSVNYVKELTRSISTGMTIPKDTAQLFTGSLQHSFTDHREQYEKNSFASTSSYAAYTRIIANMPPELASSYLSRQFCDDLQTQSPDYIISEYGTHVMLGIDLGAKLDIIYTSTTTSSDKRTTVNLGMYLGIMKVFDSPGTSLSPDNHDQWIAYEIIGGTPNIPPFGIIDLDNNPPQLDIKPWQYSVNGKENVDLIRFTVNHLIPIYEFIPDPAKKALIKDAYDRYIASKQIVIIEEPEPLPETVQYYSYQVNQTSLGAFVNPTLYPAMNQRVVTSPNMQDDDYYTYTSYGNFKFLKDPISNETSPLYCDQTTYTKTDRIAPKKSVFRLYNYSTIPTASNVNHPIGYVYKTQKEGTVPLYGYYWGITSTNNAWHPYAFLTINRNQHPTPMNYSSLYPLESIIGYVYP